MLDLRRIVTQFCGVLSEAHHLCLIGCREQNTAGLVMPVGVDRVRNVTPRLDGLNNR